MERSRWIVMSLIKCLFSRPDSCENELNALKVANKKLTATLQDTMASANEWLKKMNSYKDDCDVKQTKVSGFRCLTRKQRLSEDGELRIGVAILSLFMMRLQHLDNCFDFELVPVKM